MGLSVGTTPPRSACATHERHHKNSVNTYAPIRGAPLLTTGIRLALKGLYTQFYVTSLMPFHPICNRHSCAFGLWR